MYECEYEYVRIRVYRLCEASLSGCALLFNRCPSVVLSQSAESLETNLKAELPKLKAVEQAYQDAVGRSSI